MHQKFPGASRPMPTSQYLPPSAGARLLATCASAHRTPGSPSTRTRSPGFNGRAKRIPQPRGLTNMVWQFSENETDGSALVMRMGICALTRVPNRRCIKVAKLRLRFQILLRFREDFFTAPRPVHNQSNEDLAALSMNLCGALPLKRLRKRQGS